MERYCDNKRCTRLAKWMSPVMDLASCDSHRWGECEPITGDEGE